MRGTVLLGVILLLPSRHTLVYTCMCTPVAKVARPLVVVLMGRRPRLLSAGIRPACLYFLGHGLHQNADAGFYRSSP